MDGQNSRSFFLRSRCTAEAVRVCCRCKACQSAWDADAAKPPGSVSRCGIDLKLASLRASRRRKGRQQQQAVVVVCVRVRVC